MLVGFRAPDRGVLFVVTGPSGVGKSTLIRFVLEQLPGLGFSVSATTRAPRDGEQDGVDYHFLDPEAFEAGVREGAFLEHAQVYDRRYGTLRAPVLQALGEGRSILLDIDLLGARQVRKSMPDAVHVALLPPDLPTLEARLRSRNTDSDAIIRGRMQQVAFQLSGMREFDYLVVNDVLHTARQNLLAVLLAELSRKERHHSLICELESQLSP